MARLYTAIARCLMKPHIPDHVASRRFKRRITSCSHIHVLPLQAAAWAQTQWSCCACRPAPSLLVSAGLCWSLLVSAAPVGKTRAVLRRKTITDASATRTFGSLHSSHIHMHACMLFMHAAACMRKRTDTYRCHRCTACRAVEVALCPGARTDAQKLNCWAAATAASSLAACMTADSRACTWSYTWDKTPRVTTISPAAGSSGTVVQVSTAPS
jgi:hypothetical protein